MKILSEENEDSTESLLVSVEQVYNSSKEFVLVPDKRDIRYLEEPCDLRKMGRVCTVLANTDHQVSRLHADVPSRLVPRTPMSLGLVTKITKGTEPDHMVEFREGVELLKNEYPEKALVKLRRAFESDKHNPYYVSFLGLSMARAEQKWDHASELCEMAVQLKRTEIQFHMNLIEVYALAGQRDKALYKLDGALRLFGDDARLKRARSKVEKRRAPILPFFGRRHFLNRELGKLRHRILKRLDK